MSKRGIVLAQFDYNPAFGAKQEGQVNVCLPGEVNYTARHRLCHDCAALHHSHFTVSMVPEAYSYIPEAKSWTPGQKRKGRPEGDADAEEAK